MIKNRLFITFCLILGLVPAFFAQNAPVLLEWQKCFGGSRVEDIASVTPTRDGGYIFLGSSSSIDGDLINAGNTNIYSGRKYWIVKVSAANTLEWQRLLGGNRYEIGAAIIQTADNGYLAVGGATSFDGDVVGSHNTINTFGNGDGWVVKLSSLGAIEWQKCLGGAGNETIKSIAKTKDGGYILAGSTNSNDGDVSGNHGGYDGWVVKISALGRLEWQKCLGGSGREEFASVQQTKEGGYILAGEAYSYDGDVSGNHRGGYSDFWIVKLSNLGNLEWQKCLGSEGYETAFSVIQTFDGGYAVAGATGAVNNGSGYGDVIGYHSNSVNNASDVWVVKLSASGVFQWQKCLGGNESEIAYSMLQVEGGGYLIAGYTNSQNGDVPVHSVNPTDDHGWIIKLNNQGTLEGQKLLGGQHRDQFFSLAPTFDGGYLAGGVTFSNDGDVSGNHPGAASDAWVVKLVANEKIIIGNVEQTNTLCQALTPPQYVANAKIKISKDNATTYYTSADSLGRFSVFADTGRFTISAVTPNQLWTACPAKIITFANQRIRDTALINPTLYINSICPLMEVDLTTPFLRRCFESQYVITYANRGTAIQNDATAELTLDSMLTYISATRPVRSRVGNKITFSLGNVGINQTGQFTVNVMVSCDSRLGQTHCSSVLIPKTMTCDTVQDSIPTIINQCVAGCDSVSFLVSKPNTTLNKTFKYQVIADANLIDTGRFTLTNTSTNTFNLKKKRDGRTYRLEIRNLVTNQLLVARSAESSPTVTTPSVSMGFVNQFSQSIKQANIADNCTANRGAFDPNDKAATPTGIGTQHFIEQGNTIDYLVQFQNTGTDTAFKVVVRDTLAAQFDWSTFKLNAQSHTATWQLNPQGVLAVTFNNINLVDSFTNERGSHGFFNYSIKLKDSIVTNTVVTNKAAIYFDFNAPIITNLTTHTIGKEGLKSCLSKPAVTVNYSGCPSKNIVFNAVSTRSGANPTYAWYRNSETIPLSTTARFTLVNASNGTKIYCKLNASDDLCTETPVVTSDTIVLNCIGVPTNELPVIQAFEVFPNPNTGVFTVKLNVVKPSKMQLTILNYLGQTIKTQTISADNYAETFDLSAMPNGMYVIKLTVDGQSVVKKVSVQ